MPESCKKLWVDPGIVFIGVGWRQFPIGRLEAKHEMFTIDQLKRERQLTAQPSQAGLSAAPPLFLFQFFLF